MSHPLPLHTAPTASRLLHWLTCIVLLCAPWAVSSVQAQPEVLIDALRRGDELLDVTAAVQTEVVVPADRLLEHGWLEITSMTLPEKPPLTVALPRRTEEDEPLRLSPQLPNGPAMLCYGAEGLAVRCREAYLFRGTSGEFLGDLEIPVDWQGGFAVGGRYLTRGEGLAGARVAVVPSGLVSQRAFTLPLGPKDDSPGDIDTARDTGTAADQTTSTGRVMLEREVVSDADGFFTLPPLASGDYALETLLPSGRLHRSEVFSLPDLRTSRQQLAAAESDRVVWDLGEIEVQDGLGVEIRVQSATAFEPIADAQITARQGWTADDLINFQAASNASGIARLSGFRLELPTHLRCSAPGHLTLELEFDVVPALVLCDLEPMASLTGSVRTPDNEDITSAFVTLHRLPDEALAEAENADAENKPSRSNRPAVEVPSFGDPWTRNPLDTGPDSGAPSGNSLPGTKVGSYGVDDSGGFDVPGLAPGTYRFTVAAPQHEVWVQEVILAPGEERNLGTVRLLPGRAVTLQVVDAEGGHGLDGVQVHSLQPAGAVQGATDEDGNFEFATRSDHGLTLRFEADGYAAAERHLRASELTQDDPLAEPLRIALQRPGWVRVVIFDEAQGAPCRGCPVHLTTSTSSKTVASLTTDELGHVLSPALEPGSYRVYRPRLSHLGSTVVEQVDAERRYAQVKAGTTSLVRFGDERRQVQVRFDQGIPRSWGLRASTPYHAERLMQEPDGSFHVHHRAGETLELSLLIYDPGVDKMADVYLGTLPADLSAERLTLRLRTSAVRGRFTTWDGEPLAGQPIELATVERRHMARVWTDAEGNFHIPHAPEGVFGLHIGQRNMRFVSVSSSQTVDVGTVLLEPGRF